MRVLAVGAHPDDVEILCAGTLARYRQAGHSVAVAHLCTGDCGHYTIPPVELVPMRRAEAQAAADMLGAELLTVEGAGDGDLVADDLPRRRRVAEMIRLARPDVILTHNPDDYMPDHRATSALIFAASFVATAPHWDPEGPSPALGGIPALYYMDSLAGTGFEPEDYVDVTETFELKRRMLRCHRSQVTWLEEHDGIDIVEFMTVQSRLRGLQCGVRYAEGFRRLRVWGRVSPGRLLP